MLETITLLDNKRLLLGVTGSIAAYKAVDLASKLTQAGARVDVIMTNAAEKFVTPLTFQSVTGHPVYTDLWQTVDTGGLPTHIAHVGLGENTDLFIIAPATAHTIARLAQGMADDLLTIVALATRAPIVLAPAMDGGMYEHPATQKNIRALTERGIRLIEPQEGRFASGLTGKGRLPETPVLIGHIRRALGESGSLKKRKVVVTAGPTREAIDPARYITNHSSGKQGYALAQAAIDAGADVVLITTLKESPTIVGGKTVPVTTAREMLEAVLQYTEEADALIMAAAVADFRPATFSQQKIKKHAGDLLSIPLAPNPDILMEVRQRREQTGYPRITVGFAAESQNLIANAREKLERKHLDLLVANDITAPDAGFAADTNRVTILHQDGTIEPLELIGKARVGEIIIEKIAALLFAKSL